MFWEEVQMGGGLTLCFWWEARRPGGEAGYVGLPSRRRTAVADTKAWVSEGQGNTG